MGRRYFWNIYLTTDKYLEYEKNSQDSNFKNAVRKWAKDMNKHFPEKDTQLTNATDWIFVSSQNSYVEPVPPI